MTSENTPSLTTFDFSPIKPDTNTESKRIKRDIEAAIKNEQNLLDIIDTLKNNKYIFSKTTPPKEITLDMLKMYFDGEELGTQTDITIEELWYSYYINHFQSNDFGLYIDSDEKVETDLLLPLINEIDKNSNTTQSPL